jgi:hypothetical protein
MTILVSGYVRVGVAVLLATGCSAACGAFGGSDSTDAVADGGAGEGGPGGGDGSATSNVDGGSNVPNSDPCADAGPHRLMFATSQTFRGDLGRAPGTKGRSVADEKCNEAARGAGLPGTYVAWLSTTTDHPNVSSQKGTPIVLPRSCEVVADDFAALTNSGTVKLKAAPSSTEFGSTLTVPCLVWTNTNTSGTASNLNEPAVFTCSEWTSTEAGVSGGFGLCTSTDAQWSYFNYLQCDNGNAHLYCLQN